MRLKFSKKDNNFIEMEISKTPNSCNFVMKIVLTNYQCKVLLSPSFTNGPGFSYLLSLFRPLETKRA